MNLERQIVGVDCAVDAKNVGLAFASVRNGKCSLREVSPGKSDEQVLDVIAAWLKGGVPTLLAMDAPLGWPVAMGNLLPHHKAGEDLRVAARELFRRETDERVHDELKKKAKLKKALQKVPLAIGADRIAWTVHSTLCRLRKLIDAVVCVLAGYDYLRDAVFKPPADRAVAEREGFIWFRNGND